MDSKEIDDLYAYSDYIKWDDKFLLGIQKIDDQHKHLVALCNKLHINILENRTKTNWKDYLSETVKECSDYVLTHFHDEEVLMQYANYSGFVEHKKRHDEFTKKVVITANRFPELTMNDAIKYIKFLYDWILSHIAHEDKLYVKEVLEYYKTHQNQTE